MSTTQAKRYVNIYTESNPNPNSLKFVLNFMLVPDGEVFDFPDEQAAENSEIAKELFNYSFVERVFITANFITVSKPENINWTDIVDTLKDHIKNYFEENKPAVNLTIDTGKDSEEDTEIEAQIREILDEYIKPAVESDGGNISLHSFDENSGTVKVILQGSCSGCPSSTITLKQGIENLLKKMVPEVSEVEAINA